MTFQRANCVAEPSPQTGEFLINLDSRTGEFPLSTDEFRLHSVTYKFDINVPVSPVTRFTNTTRADDIILKVLYPKLIVHHINNDSISGFVSIITGWPRYTTDGHSVMSTMLLQNINFVLQGPCGPIQILDLLVSFSQEDLSELSNFHFQYYEQCYKGINRYLGDRFQSFHFLLKWITFNVG